MNDIKNENLDGEYKVAFKEIKEGEYNIDVNDSGSKSDKIFKVIMGASVVILLIMVIGILSSDDKKQMLVKSDHNGKQIQDLKQSYIELEEKVNNLVDFNKQIQKQLANHTEKKHFEPVKQQAAVNNDEYYKIKRVNVSKTDIKIPQAQTVEQKIPTVPVVNQKIPEIPAVDQKIPEVPAVN